MHLVHKFEGDKTLEENLKNQMMYLATWGMLKRLFASGRVDKDIIEKLNKRNAETLMCDFLPIGEIAH